MQKRSFNHRSFLSWLICLSLTSRVFIPAGFMPAPLAEGWPVMSCPGVMDGMVHQDMVPSSWGPENGTGVPQAPEATDPEQQGKIPHCPLGTFFTAAFKAETIDPLVFVPPHAGWHTATADSFVSTWSPIRALPRGPPA